MKKPLIRLTVLTLLSCITVAPTAYADTATATFNVTAHVPTSCSVSTPGTLAFGNYADNAISATTSFDVTCTSGGSYTVGLNDGVNSSAGQRRMKNAGTDYLNYDLYKEALHSNRWGNSDPTWVAGTGTGSAQSLTIYGLLPGSQGLIAGDYTDTITVTVTYTP